MKLDEVNGWLTLVANIGVLIGVFLVASELNQNQLAMQAQTRSDISETSVDILLRWSENPTLIEAFDNRNACEELERTDYLILQRALAARYRHWENTYYQYRQGLYSETEFEGDLGVWGGATARPAGREYWESEKDDFSPEFVEFIDNQLREFPDNRCEK